MIGTLSVLCILVGLGFALSIVGDATQWNSVDISFGPIEVWQFTRSGSSTEASFGPGILYLSVVGGAANAVGAYVLRQKGQHQALS